MAIDGERSRASSPCWPTTAACRCCRKSPGLFDELRFEAERVVKARVTSAAPLPAAELDTIKAALLKRFGRDVEIETAVDETLIGGAVIDAGDVVIDGSLRGKLGRLQAALSN